MIILFGPWPAKGAAGFVVVTGGFFLILGVIWLYYAEVTSALAGSALWAVALTLGGCAVVNAGLVWYQRLRDEPDQVEDPF
jgi:hypothetical protein